MFFCALSMMASRSLSLCRRSIVCWVLGRHRLVEAVRDRGQAVGNRARKLGLAAAQGFAHGAEAADRLGLDTGKRGDPLLHLLAAARFGGGLTATLARRAATITASQIRTASASTASTVSAWPMPTATLPMVKSVSPMGPF